ncbi:MAG: lipid-A-disaccharide synthase [Desulfobacterales bacterium RIFOXYA12_FULL_46_15]|nr:MAG: lipid-A-disaccharide synthase [Desulfobacterales bacterium RIFOXYA12_FULL_46_15]
MNTLVTLKHVMVLTGEPSGDFHAGRLVEEIRKKNGRIYFSGIGGPILKQQGVDLFYDIEKLSAMGITEVFLQFRYIKKAFDLFREKLRHHLPDLIILVDYPGFNLRAAKYVKDHYNIKILYYITPKVWAWKKNRLFKIKKYVDYAALIFPFEEKLFKKTGISSNYVGNPLLDEYPENFPKSLFGSKTVSYKANDPIIIGLLPGSRSAEIKNLLNIMIQSACLIHQRQKQVRFLVSKASSVRRVWIEEGIKKSGNPQLFEIVEGHVGEIFKQSNMIIAASGTVTLEAALYHIPTILIYKMSIASFWVAKLLVKVKYAGLANLIVNEEIMPELLQYKASPDKICKKAIYMINHQNYYQTRLELVRKKLGKKGAAKNTACIAIHLLREFHPI